MFEAIQRHGPLPSHYLYAFTKHLCTDIFGQRKRLQKLWNEGYLDRPPALNHPLVRTDHLIYSLSDKSRQLLAELGKRNEYATELTGGHRHAFMTACITANIELGAIKEGYKFISQEEIMAKANRQVRHPLSIPSKISYQIKTKQHSDRPTEPDQLFGIDYGNGFRFYALETDRGTESIEPKNLKANSILRKLLSYDHILRRAEYKKLFGIPVIYPMFVTTSEERVTHMVSLAEKLYPKGSKFTLFTHIPGFDFYYRTPPLLPKLFTHPWQRAGNEPLLINKP